MRSSWGWAWAIATLALALASWAHAEVSEEEGVLVLTTDNFDSAIEANPLLLVEFYAPWCGHCKSLAPEWAKAAQALKEDSLPLAKVDATENKELGDRYGVRGFPTIKLFRNGKESDYSGGRTAPEIVSWLRKKSGPAAKTLTTQAEVDEFKTKNEIAVVGYFDPTSDVGKAFVAAAESFDAAVFAVAPGVQGEGIVLFKPFDEGKNELAVSDSTSEEDITAFVSANSVALVQTFSAGSSSKIFGSKIQVHVLFFTDNTQDYHAPTVATFTELSKSFRGKLMVVNVPATEQRVLDFFGLTAADLPATYIADMRTEGSMKKFKYENAISLEPLTSFVNDFFDGKIKPALKSEEPSPADTEGPVVVVKGKSFGDVVVNNSKDVFVEFYAPWCGHCKQLEPVWNELAESFEDNKNLVIAKMDATANEIDYPGVNVKGFPTLIFFPANDKSQPVVYDGSRDLSGLSSFLETKIAAVPSEEL